MVLVSMAEGVTKQHKLRILKFEHFDYQSRSSFINDMDLAAGFANSFVTQWWFSGNPALSQFFFLPFLTFSESNLA